MTQHSQNGEGVEAIAPLRKVPTHCLTQDLRDEIRGFIRSLPRQSLAREPATADVCSCAEVAGEDPACVLHGQNTLWAKENPDVCEIAERLALSRTAPSSEPAIAESGAQVRRIPTRPLCARCHRYIVIDSVATDDLWHQVIGERHGPGYICADCFARAADERLIDWTGGLAFRPLSLAAQAGIQCQATEQGDA